MPKQLVTAIGLIVALGVIALGVFLVALPVYFQAVAVDAQTATVSSTNAVYQTQVDTLREEEANIAVINANVSALRSQIPASGQLDDVFEVVARAAEASGVALTSVTAGEQSGFVVRTSATPIDAASETAPAPDPTNDASDSVTQSGSDAPQTSSGAGRQQVDFVIGATAMDMAQATAFLEALRAGPRLLNSITAASNQTGDGTVEVQLTALTYVDTEGG